MSLGDSSIKNNHLKKSPRLINIASSGRILFMNIKETGLGHLTESIKNKFIVVIHEENKEIRKNISLSVFGAIGILGGLALIIGNGKDYNPFRAKAGIGVALLGVWLLRNSTESISEIRAASKKEKKIEPEVKKD
jgi:hypothetical protein